MNDDPIDQPTVTRADIEKAIGELRTFPRFLTDELLVLQNEAVEAMCDLLGVEAEQVIPPEKRLAEQIETATREAVRGVIDALGKSIDMQAVEESILATVKEDSQWLADHVNKQKADQ